MTDHIEDRLAALVAKMTPGPWRHDPDCPHNEVRNYDDKLVMFDLRGVDAAALTALCNITPALLAVVRAARALDAFYGPAGEAITNGVRELDRLVDALHGALHNLDQQGTT